PVFIQQDEAVHLPGEADALNVVRRDARRGDQLLERQHGFLHPVLRILFAVAGLQVYERVIFARFRPDPSGLVDEQHLDRTGPQIDADDMLHDASSPLTPAVQTTDSRYWFTMVRSTSMRPDLLTIGLFCSAYSSSFLKSTLRAAISAPMPSRK